jgi:hypothetical protein
MFRDELGKGYEKSDLEAGEAVVGETVSELSAKSRNWLSPRRWRCERPAPLISF